MPLELAASCCRGGRAALRPPSPHPSARPGRRGAMPARRRWQAARPRGSRRKRLAALIGNLRVDGQGLDWKPEGTEWADYADNTSYGTRRRPTRSGSSAEFVGRASGRGVWDLGANTGRYSRIAAEAGKPWSPSTWTRLPLSATTARFERRQRPTSCRWSSTSPTRARVSAGRAERRSLLELGDAEVVLALALVHHLAIARNVPLPMLLGLFADWRRGHRRVRPEGRPDGPQPARLARGRLRRLHPGWLPRRGGGPFEVVSRAAHPGESARLSFSCAAATDRRRGPPLIPDPRRRVAPPRPRAPGRRPSGRACASRAVGGPPRSTARTGSGMCSRP